MTWDSDEQFYVANMLLLLVKAPAMSWEDVNKVLKSLGLENYSSDWVTKNGEYSNTLCNPRKADGLIYLAYYSRRTDIIGALSMAARALQITSLTDTVCKDYIQAELSKLVRTRLVEMPVVHKRPG